jgi:serine/threonine protein kinase
VQNFEREADILATLDHPAIPAIYDYFTLSERSYLVIEFINGKDLEAIIKVVESHSPPLNLILGKDGLNRVRAKLDQLMTSIDDWEAVTLGADFPKA